MKLEALSAPLVDCKTFEEFELMRLYLTYLFLHAIYSLMLPSSEGNSSFPLLTKSMQLETHIDLMKKKKNQ